MKIYTMEYSGVSFENWANLGDDIQSLAAGKLLPRVDGGVSRERLQSPVEPGLLSMNGYFLGGYSGRPPLILSLYFILSMLRRTLWGVFVRRKVFHILSSMSR